MVQTAAILRMRSKYIAPAAQLSTFKRKAAYDLEEENVDDAQHRLSKMRIDG